MSIIAKYKFDSSIYEDLIPEFNAEFTDYTIADEVDSENSNHIIRTIESDKLPTLMRFGSNLDTYVEGSELALLEILDMNTSELTSCYRMFRYCSNLTKIECEWNTSKVTNMRSIFSNCSSLTDLDLLDFDTTNVANMRHMFYNCTNLTSLDVSNFNTSEVTDMAYMFNKCTKMESINGLSNWNTSNVTNMSVMFSKCEKLYSLDLSGWDTSKVTNIESMFGDCYTITKISGIRNWDTSNVRVFTNLFVSCYYLKSIDIHNWNPTTIENCQGMFAYCSKLVSIDMTNIDLSKSPNTKFLYSSDGNLRYIKCNSPATINLGLTEGSPIPQRWVESPGYIICKGNVSQINTSGLAAQYWNVVATEQLSTVAKYKYDRNIYEDLVPEFNEGYMGFVEDEEIDENGIVTRVIEHAELPTLMRFGRVWVEGETDADNRTDSLLKVLDMNTSGLTDCHSMFRFNTNLTSISCEWDTCNITDMCAMFEHCYNLIALDLSNFNTSKVTNMNYMFNGCQSVTSLDLSNFNTSNVTTMYHMFYNCNNLTSLDVSNFDTSNVTDMSGMFYHCHKLTTLDVSNFDTSKVATMVHIFHNTPLLKDIGMLYCDKSTINKIAPTLPTNITQTIWVEDVDIKDLTPVEGVEFKQYAKNTEVMLTSPLLEGDEIVVKDGKTYHYHKMGMVVLDGSEKWWNSSYTRAEHFRAYMYCDGQKRETPTLNDKLPNESVNIQGRDVEGVYISNTFDIQVSHSKLSTVDLAGLKQWLQANPVTVVYELAEPYYELISDEPLNIPIISETVDITNSSNIPINMIVNNSPLPTIAMNTSTEYTIAFDKSEDTSVVVDLCGSSIETTDNVVHITTPSELVDNELTIYGNGEEISNIRLLEGNVNGDSIPRESFKGLKSSFEDGYIPENALVDFPTDIYLNGTSYQEGNGDGCNVYFHTVSLKMNTVYTVFCKINEETTCTEGIGLRFVVRDGSKHYDIITGNLTVMKGVFCSTFTLTNTLIETNNLEIWNRDKGVVSISNMTILEGDWTHLTEEDWNNLGKYKVEYKVTGKNKFDIEYLATAYPNDFKLVNGELSYYENIVATTIDLCQKYNYSKNTQYTLSGTLISGNGWFTIDYTDGTRESIRLRNTIPVTSSVGKTVQKISVAFSDSTPTIITNIQLEEGSTATPYEPYKECIKTFYLNSPLLEGDTIEDVNGVATHVKRYGKVVLDGSGEWFLDDGGDDSDEFTCCFIYSVLTCEFCDKLPIVAEKTFTQECVTRSGAGYLEFILKGNTVNEFKSRLDELKPTVVYQLASPIYEPISTESILCDSYVNGHLDVDTNIPINKVDFKYTQIPLRYMQGGTNYTIQFNSDNVGKIKTLYNGNSVYNVDVVKGLNKILLLTSANPKEYIVFDGIGFNASNIQVVATDRDVDFGYFKGLQSSFESELVADEADENYGKYKVECKIVGKNKLNLPYTEQNKLYTDGNSWSNKFSFNVIKDKTYTFSLKSDFENVNGSNLIWALVWSSSYSTNPDNQIYKTTSVNTSYTFIADKTGTVYFIGTLTGAGNKFWDFQLEEGTQATSYEPYQEYTKTICLNSPLLKGDTIEVHNGKLCHYHKMGKIVLDGSEDWDSYNSTDNTDSNVVTYSVKYNLDNFKALGKILCDKIRVLVQSDNIWVNDIRGIALTETTCALRLLKNELPEQSITGVKQWLQANPTTVVYELAEPYYEEIEPTQEDLIITSVKEGDLHIDTIIPISSKVTYNVNVQLLTDFEQSIVEQVQATQTIQTTDLQSILDEEIDN